MNLLVLIEGKWKVCAPLAGGLDLESCPLVGELLKLKAGNFDTDAAGLILRMKRCAEVGPHQMSADHAHLANAKNEIYEFVKGRHRLFFFLADGAVVICSNVGMKRTRKASRQDVNQAARLREEFLHDKKQNQVSFVKGKKNVFE